MKAKNHNAKLSVQVQHMETIARLKGDLAQAISSSSATAAAAAAVSGHSPYSHSHDDTVSRAADDSAVSGLGTARLTPCDGATLNVDRFR